MKKNGILILTIVLLITGCNKKGNLTIAPDENDEFSNRPREEATAAVDAATVQQTIQGYGGMSCPIWIGDLIYKR